MVEVDIPTSYQTIKTKLESIIAKKHYTKTEINSQMANKENKGVCVTSIALVPKSSDNTGAIRLYYGDEPSDS